MPSDLYINSFLCMYLCPIFIIYLIHIFGLDHGIFIKFLLETKRISLNSDMKINYFFNTYKSIIFLNYLFESYLIIFIYYTSLIFIVLQNNFIKKIPYLINLKEKSNYNISFPKNVFLYFFVFSVFYLLAISIGGIVGGYTDIKRNNFILIIINNQFTVALVLIVLWRIIYEITWSAVNILLTKLVYKLNKKE